MGERQQLSVWDYVVLAVSLIIPILIGIKFQLTGSKKETAVDYLLGGRNASKFTVILSSSVTTVSAVTILGNPAEVFKYGLQYSVISIGFVMGMIFSSRVFIPVYYRCNVSSIYEFLEMRFGKWTRYTISALFIIQTLLYMSAVLSAPALALNAVTDFSLEMAVILFGAVCTVYCFLGGFMAVLWTDVFQAMEMFVCLIVIFVTGINEAGGFGEIFKRGNSTNRLVLHDFRLDLITRHTFWNAWSRGLMYSMAVYGTNQMEVQRSLSMSSCKRSQATIQWSCIPVFFLTFSSSALGIILYAVYYLCDPVKNRAETGLTKYDQLVPYFIMAQFYTIPGLPGICVAGIFSGSLSTISSALNALAMVTVVDFLQPLFANYLNRSRELFVSKALTLLFGTACICLTFITLKVESIIQASNSFVSIFEGPVFAVFLIGVLTRKASDKCSMIGLAVGVTLLSWISFGSLRSGYSYPPLPSETSNCTSHQNDTILFGNFTLKMVWENVTELPVIRPKISSSEDTFILYKIPFTWMPIMGFCFTFSAMLIMFFIPGLNEDVIPPDSKCLSPVTRLWTKYTSIDENVKQGNTAIEMM